MTDPGLMPHQEEAAGKLRNGAILKGSVGSGKTRTAFSYYCQFAPWIKLYVITTAMKRDSGDWEAEAALWGCEVVVDSWNNMMKYEDVENAFFIFDEQRVVGSGIWVKSFLRITKKNRWILLSATPGDTWLDYIPVFIAHGFYANRTDFLRTHVVFSRFTKYPKVERILGERSLTLYLQKILVEMSYERHTTRHKIDVFADYDKELYNLVWKRRWNYLEERPIRQASELFSLLRRVVNSDPSRLERIRDLLIEHPKIIIFYNFDYELEILRTLRKEDSWNQETPNQQLERGKTGEYSGSSTATAEEHGYTSSVARIPGSFVVAEWNGHNHDPIPEGDEWVYLVQYAAGAEGWNCTTTDTTVFYSLNYSYRKTEQAKGRIDRLNTPYTDLRYYIIRSQSAIDCAVFSALEQKRDFNEKMILKSGDFDYA
jgi:hypothetical protein